MTAVKLGGKQPVVDNRTLSADDYGIHSWLPRDIPPTVDYFSGAFAQLGGGPFGDDAAFGMMLNDTIGDCTIAALAHAEQVWTYMTTGTATTPSDADVELLYWNTGTPPADTGTPGGPTDDGRYLLPVLKYVKANDLFGTPIQAFVGVSRRKIHIKAAIYFFGGIVVSLALPNTALDQYLFDKPWAFVPSVRYNKAGSAGWHEVFVCGYDPLGMTCITWGQVKHMTWEFVARYCSAQYAVLADAWLANGRTAGGYKLVQIYEDLALIP